MREHDHGVVAVGVSTTSTLELPGGSVSLPGIPQLNTTRCGGSMVM